MLIDILTSRDFFVKIIYLRGNAPQTKNCVYFVRSLKIINTFLKTDVSVLKQMSETLKYDIRISVGHIIHELLVKICKILFLSIESNSRLAWAIKILMPFSRFSNSLLQDAYFIC